MRGIYNRADSWEKQQRYNLENGWIATVEYSEHYGEHLTRLDNPINSTYWHCSNGLCNLPEFARAWVRGGSGPDKNLVGVGFEKHRMPNA